MRYVRVVLALLLPVMVSAYSRYGYYRGYQRQQKPKHKPAPFKVVSGKLLTFPKDRDKDLDLSGFAVDSAGNVYISGAIEPDGDWSDVFWVKLDGKGNVVWAKMWGGNEYDGFPPPAENGLANGGAGSRGMAVDEKGFLYLAGSTKSGVPYYAVFVLKINPSDGSIVWQKLWKPVWNSYSSGSAKAFSVFVKAGKVFITGTTGGGKGSEESHLFLLVLNADDGSVIHQKIADPSPSYNDRGYVVYSPDGKSVYVGGWAGVKNTGMLMKFSESGGRFDWFEVIGIGYGSRINDIDADSKGNLYLSCDIHGRATVLAVLKTSPDGTVKWGRMYTDGSRNDRNNTYAVRVLNGNLYVGGRVGLKNFEIQMGDGVILKFDLSGKFLWGANYHTGYIYNEVASDWIKGFAYVNGVLYAGGFIWPKRSNYAGKWYSAEGMVRDFMPDAVKVDKCEVFDSKGEVKDAMGFGLSDVKSYSVENVMSFSNRTRVVSKSDIYIFKLKE